MPERTDKRSLSHGLTRLTAALAALVLLAVSAAMNYLFLSSLGKTPVEAQVLGAASAAADLLKAVLPFLILWAWRAGRYSVAGPGAGRLERAGRTSARRGKRKRNAWPAAQGPDGTVEDFAWACLQLAKGNTLSDKALFEAYRRWCAGEGRRALDESAFSAAFADLARKVGIRREHGSYHGIKLTTVRPSRQ